MDWIFGLIDRMNVGQPKPRFRGAGFPLSDLFAIQTDSRGFQTLCKSEIETLVQTNVGLRQPGHLDMLKQYTKHPHPSVRCAVLRSPSSVVYADLHFLDHHSYDEHVQDSNGS